MEFVYYLAGGMMDLIVLIILLPLYPFMKILEFKKLTAFVEKILMKIFSKEGLF